MKLKFLFAFILFFRLLNAQVPTWQWAQSASGTGSDTGNGVAVDGSGNVYVTGYFFSPTITFGTYTLTNSGNYEVYTVKYDATGNVMWAKSAAGAFDDIGTAITTDASGNIYITGNFTSPTLVFGTYTLTNSGGDDIFIVKYDTNGNIIWAKSEGGSNSEESNSITTDAVGNIFITGQFQSSIFTIGTYTLNNTGIGDVFVAKYSALGNPLWAVSHDGDLLDIGYGISSDASGNVFVTGYFKSTTTTIGTYTLANATPGSADMFVAKYNSSGVALWAKSAGGNFEEIGYGITSDAGGNIVVCGSYKSSVITFGTYTFTNAAVGSCDLFVTKYDGTGNVQWAKSSGGNSDDIALSVDADLNGDIYVTGHMHSTSMMVGSYTLSNTGVSVGDVFVINYNVAGNVLWAEKEGGFLDDGGASIVTGTLGNVYLTGFFVGPIIQFGSYVLNNSSNSDVFVSKLGSTIGMFENGQSLLNNFIVYPNPSNGVFEIIGLNESDSAIENIEIHNLVGDKIYCIKTLDSPIDMADKPKGIYFINIKTSKEILTRKIVLN